MTSNIFCLKNVQTEKKYCLEKIASMINVEYMILFYTRATNLISPFTCFCVDLVHLVYLSIKNHFLVKGKIKKITLPRHCG